MNHPDPPSILLLFSMIEQSLKKLAEIKQEIGEKKCEYQDNCIMLSIGYVSTANHTATQDRRHQVCHYRLYTLALYSNRRSGTMRRGTLMTVLQQYALDQPVWKGRPNDRYSI